MEHITLVATKILYTEKTEYEIRTSLSGKRANLEFCIVMQRNEPDHARTGYK